MGGCRVTMGAVGPLYQHLPSLSRAQGSVLSTLPITAIPFFTVLPRCPRELDSRYASPSYLSFWLHVLHPDQEPIHR